MLDHQVAHRAQQPVQHQRNDDDSKQPQGVRKRQINPVMQGTRHIFDEGGV
jgi:hypothetical protein